MLLVTKGFSFTVIVGFSEYYVLLTILKHIQIQFHCRESVRRMAPGVVLSLGQEAETDAQEVSSEYNEEIL